MLLTAFQGQKKCLPKNKKLKVSTLFVGRSNRVSLGPFDAKHKLSIFMGTVFSLTFHTFAHNPT